MSQSFDAALAQLKQEIGESLTRFFQNFYFEPPVSNAEFISIEWKTGEERLADL